HREASNGLWPARRFPRVRLSDITSEEFASISREDPVVILPIGALEEHGRHLPLGADMIQPLHVLDEVARRSGAFVAPPIPYGGPLARGRRPRRRGRDLPHPDGEPGSREGTLSCRKERDPAVRGRRGSEAVLVRGDGGPRESLEGPREEARRPRDRRTGGPR